MTSRAHRAHDARGADEPGLGQPVRDHGGRGQPRLHELHLRLRRRRAHRGQGRPDHHLRPLADKAVNDPPFTVSATTTSPLTVSFGASGACTVLGDEVTLTGAVGSCTITASQGGDDNWNAAEDVDQSFAVGTGTTTTTLATSGSPSVYGDEVTFTATVSPSAATGTVIFYDGATVLDWSASPVARQRSPGRSTGPGTTRLPPSIWVMPTTPRARATRSSRSSPPARSPSRPTRRPRLWRRRPRAHIPDHEQLTRRRGQFTGGLDAPPARMSRPTLSGREPSTSASATASRSWVPTS